MGESAVDRGAERLDVLVEVDGRNGALGDEFKAAFRALTGMALSARPLRIRPNDVDKRGIVRNYDEAAAAIDSIAVKCRSMPVEAAG